jgi:two-component system NarL family response regulator
MSIRVLLVDDHTLVREGIRSILERETDLEVVGEAGNGRTAVELSERLQPDVIVIDIGMPDLNGVEASRRIKGCCPKTKIVALSTHSDKRYVLAMIDAGSSGYVLKESAGDELLRAIRAVMQGRKYLSPEVAGVLVDSYTGREFHDNPSSATFLGSREREVLQLLAEGKSSPEIAKVLFISVSTVEAHRRNIMKKLDLHSVAALTKYAIREGLTTL